MTSAPDREPAELAPPTLCQRTLPLTDEWLQADRVTIVPILNADDPLLQHLALVLQAAIEGESVAGRLYTESLIDALVVHFLRGYAAAQQPPCEETGGLSPYKLRRTIAYIQGHLARSCPWPRSPL